MPTSSDPGRVRATDLGKRYLVVHERPRLLGLWFLRDREFLWALRHVELDLEPGDALGVVGPNGSGKSTLLRVLSGVTAPTEGTAVVGGRVSSLITIGAGFHQELTGRENVFVGGAVLGLPRKEILERFDEIVEFSGVAGAIDRPVKQYSSGMFMRLGFSLAAFARPDVLLVDEVLAVGDAAFWVRCSERIDQLRRDGVTIVFVSHAMSAVERLCPRSIVLSRGEVVFDGPTAQAVARYVALLDEPMDAALQLGQEADAGIQAVVGGASVTALRILRGDGHAASTFPAGSRATVRAEVEFARDAKRIRVVLGVVSGIERVYVVPCGEVADVRAGERVDVEVPLTLHLGAGTYSFVLSAIAPDEDALLVRHRSGPFYVSPTDRSRGWGVADLEAEPSIARARPDAEPLARLDERTADG